MKKTFLEIAFCTLACAPLQAQTTDRLRLGIEAGFTVSNFTNSDRYCRMGGFVGLRGEYDYGKSLFFAGGLRFIGKGADSLNGYDGAADESFSPRYIEIPLSVGIYKQFNRRLRLFAETGPYLAFGVGGRMSGSYNDLGPGQYSEWDRRFFSKESGNPRRFDPGWGARAGFRCKHFSVSMGYEIGFRTLWKQTGKYSGYDSGRNSSFNVGVSYMFY